MPTLSESNFAVSPADALVVPSYAAVPFSSSQKLGVVSSQATPEDSVLPSDAAEIEGSLEKIERRERQLWITLGGLSLLLTIGMVLLVLPQLMEISSARPERGYLPRLFLRLVAL